jgi:uncharacterized protein
MVSRRRTRASARRPRIVLDTNLMVPGLVGVARKPPATTATAVLVRAAQARVISLVVSEPLLAEVERVLQYPSFGVSASTASRMVRAVRGIATVVEIPNRLAILITDPDDNVVLETAFAGKADMLATANLAHFEEVRSRGAAALRFRGVDIVSLSRCHERIRHEWPEAHELLHRVWGWSS